MRLETSFLGLDLAHPFVADASSLTATLDDLRRKEDAGAAAVITRAPGKRHMTAWHEALDAAGTVGAESHPEVTSYLPPLCGRRDPREAHLETLRRAAEALSVPLIAGICGADLQGAVAVARDLEIAGAAAIEIDFFRLATDPAETSADVERQLIGLVHSVRHAVEIPIAVRLRPVFSAPVHLAHALAESGADGIVIAGHVNASDVDVETTILQQRRNLPTRDDFSLPLLWIGLLSQRTPLSLAIAADIRDAGAAANCLLAGADAVAAAPALYAQGDNAVIRLNEELRALPETRHARSLSELHGRLPMMAADRGTTTAAAFAGQRE